MFNNKQNPISTLIWEIFVYILKAEPFTYIHHSPNCFNTSLLPYSTSSAEAKFQRDAQTAFVQPNYSSTNNDCILNNVVLSKTSSRS